MGLPETFYLVVLVLVVSSIVYYSVVIRNSSLSLASQLLVSVDRLMNTIEILEAKIASIAVVNQRQIQNLETSLEAAKKRANAAESKLAALYTQNPQLKRRRS